MNDERQDRTAILSNLEGTELKLVVAKNEEERDTVDKIFEILLNRFGSGMKDHQAMIENNAPTPEEMRPKSRKYMLMKPKKYSYSENRNMQWDIQPQRSTWYKPRDDMDKRSSCANCGSPLGRLHDVQARHEESAISAG